MIRTFTKRRISAAEVAQRPEWRRALYDQGALTDPDRQSARQHLTGIGLRRTAHIRREDDQ
ncbi:hypothetical protein [Nocardiopsis sp. NRRL B-16309]|uniref:hypothetical protein n=1 Tax=Nocardiopsis sp. NRRL B-16309 TaxID=1519494 RepID=UPI0006AFE8FE|nr:hypothetical protein [Nocardiopsis sp. NRRL B-16309]KOX18063.1 hypothetical protein ADL05_08090 [Nocardiopsis sp. NRRL B-16309]